MTAKFVLQDAFSADGACSSARIGTLPIEPKNTADVTAVRRQKRTSMLKKFAIALIAAGLIAAPALANSSPSQTSAAAQTRSVAPKVASVKTVKQTKRVAHVRRHYRKHVAKVHVNRHAKHARHQVKSSVRKAG
jgi:hypothetical protein